MQYDLFGENPPPSPEQTLDEFLKEMYAMTDDPLADAGTNVVICRGEPETLITIVGEAPGPNENIQGVPFVGRAGKLLDQILEAAGFDPEKDVFITNSVFRMPPGEGGKNFRKPTTAEIEGYKPYLKRILNLVDPKILILTGNVACQSVLGLTGITKLRGEWRRVDDRWVMPVFHPAYLLRNPSKAPGSPKSLMWEDIQTVRRKWEELQG